MNPPDLREDLKQELFIVLCEMDEEKLIEISEKRQLKFYAVRIMLNLIQSKTSPFYYKYRKNVVQEFNSNTHTVIDSNFDERRHEQMIKKVAAELEVLHWYEKDLFNLYMESGCNAAELSRDIGIPKRSIYQTIKNVKDKIKRRIQI